MSAQAFVEAARGLLGTPWRHRGRKPWGVDCIGLVVLSARAAGYDAPDPGRYGREPWDGRLRAALRAYCGDPIDKRLAQVGDIALIQWDKGEPSHVGVVADYLYGGLSLIHANNLHGVVEHAMSGHYYDVVQEVYRLWPVKSSR